MTLEICYTTPDQDLELHKFLCVISAQVLRAPIDPVDSLNEIIQVREHGMSLVVRAQGEIIGALGLTATGWWYNHAHKFFTDRWFFVYPAFVNQGVAAMLLAEAGAVATAVNMDIIINGKLRHRNGGAGRGILFNPVKVITPDAGVDGCKKGASVH